MAKEKMMEMIKSEVNTKRRRSEDDFEDEDEEEEEEEQEQYVREEPKPVQKKSIETKSDRFKLVEISIQSGIAIKDEKTQKNLTIELALVEILNKLDRLEKLL